MSYNVCFGCMLSNEKSKNNVSSVKLTAKCVAEAEAKQNKCMFR